MPVIAFLALGANLANPQDQISEAIRRLGTSALHVLRRARIYRSKPVGPQEQPDYLNTVVEVRTELSPWAALERIKTIETEMGRTPSEHWGPRLIDIDIVTFGQVRMSHADLIIPHKELTRRAFVLVPLADLAPQLFVPGVDQPVNALLAGMPRQVAALEVVDDAILSGVQV